MTAVNNAVSSRDVTGTAVPLYFGPDGAKLFGWLHKPDGSPTGPVIVICSPVGFPMIMSHRGLRHLAQAAARAGMPALRFDYHGTGDSSGSDHEPGRVNAWIASVGHAIEEARRLTGAPEVVLVGLRVGCLLAAYAASMRSDVRGLVAWAPVASGRTQVRELRAVGQLMSGYEPVAGDVPEGAVVAAGFIFTRETIERLGELDIHRLGRAPAPRALVVPRDDLSDDDRFATTLEDLGTQVTRDSFPGFAGMMRDAHATVVPEEAIRGILEWAEGLGATPWAAAVAPDPPVLRGITSGAEFIGLSNSAGAPVSIEEYPLQVHDGRLFGILTRPVHGAAANRPAIIFANAGAVHRIGASRLYVTMARAWAERGFPVLRLDIGGIGDSPPYPGMAENDTYSARAVADIGEAAAALPNECRTGGLVIAGLCSGAHAAFHAALSLRGIVGIIMMNPVVFYWKPSDALEVSAWMTHRELRRYQQRVTSLASWRRVLQGKVDILGAARTLGIWMGDRITAYGRAFRRSAAGRALAGPGQEDVVEDLTRICAQGIDVLLVFSQGDPGLDHLRAQFPDALDRLKRIPRFAYYGIPWSGHTFTNAKAQQMLIGLLSGHLMEAFPGQPFVAMAPQVPHRW